MPSFTRSTVPTDSISQLPDKPTISASALKSKFDAYGEGDKPYINNILLPELEANTIVGSDGGSKIGLKLAQFVSTNVTGAILELYTTISTLVLGQLPNRSVTYEKITLNTLTEAEMANDMKKGISGGVASYDNTLSLGGGTMSGAIDMNDNEIKRAKMKDYSEVVTVLTNQTGTVNLDLSLGNNFAIASMTGNITLTFSNWPVSGIDYPFKIEITQGATPRAVTFPSSFKFPNDIAPNVAQANKVSTITGYSRDGGVKVRVGSLTSMSL